MRTLLPLGILISLAGPVACGPPPTPDAPKQQQADVKPGPATVATSAPFDLSPVAEPADVVGVLRWGNPAETLATLTGCAGLPPQLVEGNARVAVEELLGDALGGTTDRKQLAAVVALDAPVHVLVALDSSSKRGKPVVAVSIGLVSLERAKGAVEAAGPPTEVSPGMWRIGGKERTSSTCVIAASAGSTPARLICGDRDRDVAALGPYLARTMPTLAPDARDIHGEVRFVPLSSKFGALAKAQLRGLPILAQSEFSIGEPKFDRALMEAANAVTDELNALVGDADKVTLDIDVNPRTCVTASGAVELKGKSSWLAGSIADRPDRAGPPPPIFWRAPKDSDAAFFARGADPARYSEILKTLRALLEGWLNKEGVGKPADRKALADLLSTPLGKDTNSVSASGHVDAPAPKGDKPGPQQLLDSMLGSWLGWNLVGVDEGPDASIKYFKDLVAVYNRPGLLGALKKELGSDAKLLPTVKSVPAPKELGKSSFAVEIAFKDIPTPDDSFGPPPDKPSAKPKTLSFTMHILLMGEDKATWIAFGNDKAQLLSRLAAVKSGAPDSGTLASRPGLEHLKNGKLMSGGFLTLSPITRAFTGGLRYFAQVGGSGGMPGELQQAMNLLNSLPHKAETPIFITGTSRGGNTPRGEISFLVPKPALEDIGAIVLGGMKIAGALNP